LSDVVREKTLASKNDPESWVSVFDCADNDSWVEINAQFISGWSAPIKETVLLSTVFKGCDIFLDVECVETSLDTCYTYKNGKLISQE
jgi:hypothetical protein